MSRKPGRWEGDVVGIELWDLQFKSTTFNVEFMTVSLFLSFHIVIEQQMSWPRLVAAHVCVCVCVCVCGCLVTVWLCGFCNVWVSL